MIRQITHDAAVRRNHALVVQTCRRAHRYFAHLLASLPAAGIADWQGPKIVIADGYDPHAEGYDLRGWDVVSSDGVLGQARTFFRGLGYVSEFQQVTWLEDDVVLARSALDYIGDVRVDADVFLASWFSLYENTAGAAWAWHLREMREYARNQAITLPKRTLQAVIDDERVAEWPLRSGADRIFGLFWPEETCAIHYPNLVQHIGDVSEVGEQGVQRSPTFVARVR